LQQFQGAGQARATAYARRRVASQEREFDGVDSEIGCESRLSAMIGPIS